MQKLKEAFECMTYFCTICANLDRKQNYDFRASLNYALYHPQPTIYDLAQEVHVDSEHVHHLNSRHGGFGPSTTSF